MLRSLRFEEKLVQDWKLETMEISTVAFCCILGLAVDCLRVPVPGLIR